jgi:NTP pyrophosphatase (non-canonical NTP hydrolase)
LHPLRVLNSSSDPQVEAVAHYLFLNDMLSVLIEEVGEVGKAMQGDGILEEELVQVAAVCVRFLEHMK